jgi:hypothetical protein
MRDIDVNSSRERSVGAEDAARGLALFVALVFGLTLSALLLLGFVQALPGSIVLLIGVSIVVVGVSAAWAIFRRSFSTPASYHTGPPVIKIRKRRARRQPVQPTADS